MAPKRHGSIKAQSYRPRPDSQGTCIIELDETDDSAILAIINANPGYIWNVTQNEVVYCRSANTTTGEISCVRGLFGTSVGIGPSRRLNSMNIVTLSTYVPMCIGEFGLRHDSTQSATRCPHLLLVVESPRLYCGSGQTQDTGEFVPGRQGY